MTQPLTEDTWFDPGRAGAATLRTRWTPSRSLALERLKRGLKRQVLVVLLLALAVGAAATAYVVSDGGELGRGLVIGLAVGVAVAVPFALLRELGRNTVTSISSLGRHRDHNVLGGAPELTTQALRQVPPDQRTPIGCLAFLPASPFATAFRDLQGSLAEHKAVAFIGATPGEGATTAALCAAASAAQQGRSVVVVDCDLRRRGLTRAIGEDPAIGLMEACEAPDEWRDFLLEETETGVYMMPAARSLNPWKPLLSQEGFRPLIDLLRETYDLVVLDCPPALTSAEGAVIASLADATVVVTAWDRTRVSALADTVRMLKRRRSSLAGIYVNRVPPGYRFGRLRGA